MAPDPLMSPEGVVLSGVTVIDGTGAPPYGPVDVVIRGDRIAGIETNALATSDCEPVTVMDLAGCFVLPGLIDAHAHLGSEPQISNVQYSYDLWLAHGVTRVRELGALDVGLDLTLDQAQRSAAGKVEAPFIHPYARFPGPSEREFRDETDVVTWLAETKERGAEGVKFFGTGPTWSHRVAIERAPQLGLGTAFHHAPIGVARMNALTTAHWGLRSIEHGYGIAEAMLVDGTVQHYLPGHNDADERSRFVEAGRVWAQTERRGTPRWDEIVDSFVDSGVTMVPTFCVYVGARDAHRVQDRRWHPRFTTRRLLDFWDPVNGRHGSFLRRWGSVEESIWRRAFRGWMDVVRAFHVRGGRIAVGADSGYAYSHYGFSYVEELELLLEAGLSPLEVVRAATMGGAELLGVDDTSGSVEIGKQADLVVTATDPLENFKSLYAHGASALGVDGDAASRSSVRFVVKAGQLFDAEALRSRARAHVSDEPR